MAERNDITFRLHQRQGEVLLSEANEILYGGAAGGGKSHLMRILAIMCCLYVPGLLVYLFRRYSGDLIQNHFNGPTGFPELLAPFIEDGYCKISYSPHACITFWNGAKIMACHCQYEKDVERFRGAEIHLLLMVRATLKGKGGHSSAPWKCEDLITQLSEAVVKIKAEWYRRHPLADGLDHWSDVLTPTVIKSEGTALNRIPSEVWVNFNLRSVRPEAKDECLQLIREITKGEVEVVRYSPPCVSDGNDPYVQRLKKAMEAEFKAPVPLQRMPFATDARCFVSCGVPVVNIGHDHGDSHAATEWATADSIDLVTRYLTKFILDEYK